MYNEITIKSQQMLERLHIEAARIGVDPFILIEGFLVKGLTLNALSQKRYQDGLEIGFTSILKRTSGFFKDLQRQTLNADKPAAIENMEGTGVTMTVKRIVQGKSRDDHYNREYDVFLSHPGTDRIVKFNLHYTLGIFMGLKFEIIALEPGKRAKVITYHTKKYKPDIPKDMEKMQTEINAHLKTLYLEKC